MFFDDHMYRENFREIRGNNQRGRSDVNTAYSGTQHLNEEHLLACQVHSQSQFIFSLIIITSLMIKVVYGVADSSNNKLDIQLLHGMYLQLLSLLRNL